MEFDTMLAAAVHDKVPEQLPLPPTPPVVKPGITITEAAPSMSSSTWITNTIGTYSGTLTMTDCMWYTSTS